MLLLAILATGTGARGQTRIYVNEYLNIGVGARGLAMAGAQAASTGDVTSAYWNPAGLTKIKEPNQIGLMHAEYFSGNAKYDYLGLAKPLKDKRNVVALSLFRFAVDDIPYTLDYIQPDGSFDESKLKSLSAGDYALFASYARRIKLFKDPDAATSIGVNAKVIYRHLGKMATAWGAGIDVGLQTTYKRWQMGVVVRDITTTYTAWSFNLTEREKQIFGQTGNELPVKSYEVMLPRICFTAARRLLRDSAKIQVLVEAGADLTTDGRRPTLINTSAISLDPRIGIEVGYKKTIFLRLGAGNFQRVLDDADTANQKKVTLFQPSAGLGIQLHSLRVDYAFTSLQTQSNPLYTHIISLQLSLRGAAKPTGQPRP
jgi:hypothetical protein